MQTPQIAKDTGKKEENFSSASITLALKYIKKTFLLSLSSSYLLVFSFVLFLVYL